MDCFLSTSGPAIDRRRFLARSLAGITAGAVAGGCASSRPADGGVRPARHAERPWRMRLSTSSIHFKELPLEQACARIAALGFEAIDIWSAYDQCPHLDDARVRLGPSGLRDLLAHHRLKLFAFSVYVGGFAKYAALLGGVGGGVAIQGSAPPCEPQDLTAKMRAFFENLKPLAELAVEHGSWLAVENHGQALLDGPDSFRAFVDLNPWPRVGIALAPYHVQALGASVEEVIGICGSQLLFFYAWQNQPAVNQLPGHGPTDFGPWLRALARVGYRGYVNPFMHGHLAPEAMTEALGRARDALRHAVG